MPDQTEADLRAVAEAANGPGPWDVVGRYVSVGSVPPTGASTFDAPNTTIAAYIARFDPPTVLALMDTVTDLRAEVGRLRLGRAEFADANEALRTRIDRAEEIQADRMAEAVARVTPCSCSAQRTRAEAAEADATALRAYITRWEKESDEDRDRAEAAEAALARVSTLADEKEAEIERINATPDPLTGRCSTMAAFVLIDELRAALAPAPLSTTDAEEATDG